MPNIKPISDLHNYDNILNDVVMGNPLFLTSEGRGNIGNLQIYFSEIDKFEA